jgi:hypothetical protein
MIDAIIVPLAPSVQTKTSLRTLASGTLACRANRASAHRDLALQFVAKRKPACPTGTPCAC